MKRLRLPLLLLSGIIILVLVLFRQQQLAHWKAHAPPRQAAPRALAPRFEVADHRRHIVKFERFLGRQRVVLVFFDSKLGADQDPRVQRLLECFETISGMGVEVVAISDATPYANAAAEKRLGKEFPFPLLTDIDLKTPVNSPVHRQWGLYHEKTDTPETGLFLVARDGTIPLGADGYPRPVDDESAVLDALCQGEWPR